MANAEFDWDRHNEEHVLEHGVEPDEAMEALLDPKRIGVSAYSMGEERRWAAIGTTEDGRVLFIVFTRKRGGDIRVITARDVTLKEKRRYRRKGR